MVVGELKTKVDVAVIGAGPGGYTAAIRAAQLGLEVVLIEKDKLGGICTNVGCIPTKALIHAARVKNDAESENAKRMGINATIVFDLAKAQQWKDGVVTSLREGIATLCRLNGVEVIKGRAFFASSSALTVETETGLRSIEFRKAVIAAGTKVKGLDNLPFDHRRVMDSDDALTLTEIPERLIVVGAGYIALEIAGMFARFGSKVTLIYRGERFLKRMERDLADALQDSMKKDGIDIHFSSAIETIEGGDTNVAVVKTPQGSVKLPFDKILVAVGRTPQLDGLGLEKTKVRLNEDGFIVVDSAMRTSDENIYAVGDVVPAPQLAHVAFREGKVAAEAIAGQKSAFDNVAIPLVIFTDPEIASVGLSEEEARGRGRNVRIGKIALSALGRAKTIGRTDGFVKIVADEKGVVLGVHAIGAEASAMIAEAALATEMAATLEDLALTIHAHPTMNEALQEAAEDALGKPIHVYRPNRQGR